MSRRLRSSPSWLLPVAASVASGLIALALRDLGDAPLRFEMGGYEDGFVEGSYFRTIRVYLDPENAPDRQRSYYYRVVFPDSRLRLPIAANGQRMAMTLRCASPVESRLSVAASGVEVGHLQLRAEAWRRRRIEVPVELLPAARVELDLSLSRTSSGGRHDLHSETLHVDYVEIQSDGGLRLTPPATAWLAAGPTAALLLFVALAGPWAGLAAWLPVQLAVVLASRADPLSTQLALPRLLPVALLAASLAWLLLGRARDLVRRDRLGLTLLLFLGVLAHGSLPFFPNHSPPDLEVHILRAADLALVPGTYEGWLRYGSHLGTPSTWEWDPRAMFGDRALVPYSPLSYIFYYGLERAGLDMRWSLTVSNAVLAMALVPWGFLTGSRLFGREAGWLAALLLSLDLAVWHHVGRAHAPSAFGNALAVGSLLYLARAVDSLATHRGRLRAGFALAIGVLGYPGPAILITLFGAALLVLLALDAQRVPRDVKLGLAVALALGALLAGSVYYFHYLPGLLQAGVGTGDQPDLFQGARFWIFRNEPKQALRLWRLGLDWVLVAGLVAAPFALRRSSPGARVVLLAWLAAWALLMLLKDPILFPRALRWAKEDHFLTPLLALFVGAAVAAIPRRALRLPLALAILFGAAALQLRDFLLHANSLRL